MYMLFIYDSLHRSQSECLSWKQGHPPWTSGSQWAVELPQGDSSSRHRLSGSLVRAPRSSIKYWFFRKSCAGGSVRNTHPKQGLRADPESFDLAGSGRQDRPVEGRASLPHPKLFQNHRLPFEPPSPIPNCFRTPVPHSGVPRVGGKVFASAPAWLEESIPKII
jgi:hypothetical protein